MPPDSGPTGGATVLTLAGTGLVGRADGRVSDTLATFNLPTGVAADAAGNIYVADTGNHLIRRVGPGGATLTVAGSGVAGSADGTGPAASFASPTGLAYDGGTGRLYIADRDNDAVRVLASDGAVSRLSTTPWSLSRPQAVAVAPDGAVYVADTGNDRVLRLRAGQAAEIVATGLVAPAGVAVDGSGRLYVADTGRHVIRRLDAGVLSVWAGMEDVPGLADDVGVLAQFNAPAGLAFDGDGDLQVADRGNNFLRSVDTGQLASTRFTLELSQPGAVAVDAGGNVYVGDTGNNRIRKFSALGVPGTLAGASTTGGLVAAADGTLYVADAGRHVVRKIAGGVATVLAGSGRAGYGYGNGALAQFNTPSGVAVGPDGVVYVADSGNVQVQQIRPNGDVSLFARAPRDEIGVDAFYLDARALVRRADGVLFAAGSQSVLRIDAQGTPTLLAGYSAEVGVATDVSFYDDGAGSFDPSNQRYFFGLHSIAVDAAGNLYVTDTLANSVRMVMPGTVANGKGATIVTLAGAPDTGAGDSDGTGSAATFNAPRGLVIDADGHLIVADSGNHRLRKIVVDRSGSVPVGIVSAFAGASTPGKADGSAAAARFNSPQGLALDASGDVLVLDGNNNLIRRVTRAGVVTTVPGLGTIGRVDGNGNAPSFGDPHGLALGPGGTLVVADTGNHLIRTIAPDGSVGTRAGSGQPRFADGTGTAASFDQPRAVAVDAAGSTYVADTVNHRIRRIDVDGHVTTLAGSGQRGDADGLGTAARFDNPQGIVVDAAGARLYVADSGNHRIRLLVRGASSWSVTTLAGSGTAAFTDGVGTAASFSSPSGLALQADGQLIVADTQNHRIRRVSTTGAVSTVAGSGARGSADGAAAAATFDTPRGVAVDAAGRIVVADSLNNLLRRIGTDGRVTRLAGAAPPYAGGYSQLTPAISAFYEPVGVVVGPDGRIYVANAGYQKVSVVTVP